MPIQFPLNPTTGQTYTYNGNTWRWDGEGWEPGVAIGATGATGVQGIQGNVGLTGPAGTSANITVYDEGTLVTNTVTGINFVGAGITANLVAGNVTVTVTATGTGGGTGGSALETSNFTYTAGLSQTIYAATSGITANTVLVTVDGVVQAPSTSYTVSGSDVVFMVAPPANSIVQIRVLGGGSGGSIPKITSIQVANNSYTAIDDTAVSTSGGYIVLTGTGFVTGCQVLVGTVLATSVSFVSSTAVGAQVPALAAGTYTVYLVNSDGGVAIRVNGLNYSSTPSWQSASTLSGTVNTAISIQLTAVSNSTVTYALQTGSTLPAGLSLSTSGLLSGTVTGITVMTTYNFTVIATDVELQDTPQAFSITIDIADPYYRLTTLHLPGVGSNAAQNNTFLDGSTNNFTITRSGNTTQGTFSPFSQTGWSVYLNGSSYLSIADNAALDLSGDFTIEFWIYWIPKNSTDYTRVLSKGYYNAGANSWDIGIHPDGTYIYFNYGNPNAGFNCATNLKAGWAHFAVTRAGSAFKMFLNGAIASSGTLSQDFTSTYPLVLGTDSAANSWAYTICYISNFRIIKGTALYTTAFTPSASPLTAVTNTSLLICQDNRFKDNSTNNFTITLGGSPSVQAFSPFAPAATYSPAVHGGSAYFDGSGDYLTVGSASDWTFLHNGSSWTIEFFIYNPGITTVGTIVSTGAASADTGFTCDINNFAVNEIRIQQFRSVGDSLTIFRSNPALLLYQWNSVAITFDNATKTCSFYINGTIQGSSSNSGFAYSASNPNYTLAVGRYQYSVPGGYFTGYLSNLRISKFVKTGLTSIATNPFTSDTTTSLLLNFTNAGIYDATSKNNLETVGGAQISTVQSRWGGSSMSFDGSGDYLIGVASNPQVVFGTGDLTIEWWIYTTSLATNQYIFDTRDPASSSSAGLLIGLSTAGKFFSYIGSSLVADPFNTVISINVWTHVAFVRINGAWKLFINGVADSVTPTNATSITQQFLTIGTAATNRDTSSTNKLNGYLQDLRITRGYARYTSNFTPPTAAFQTL